jgi:hypothetical protein
VRGYKRKLIVMIQQTIFSFKIETTKGRLTAHGGLAWMAEFHYGIGLREHTDRYLPSPESNLGFNPSLMVDSLVLMLQGGRQEAGRSAGIKTGGGVIEDHKSNAMEPPPFYPVFVGFSWRPCVALLMLLFIVASIFYIGIWGYK